MIITDAARDSLKATLEENGQDALKVSVQQSCCGSSLYFTMAKKEENDSVVVVNGINVLMEGEAMVKAETITIELDDEEKLVVTDSAPAQSCGDSCGGGCC